jgi:hypothetical protein
VFDMTGPVPGKELESVPYDCRKDPSAVTCVEVARVRQEIQEGSAHGVVVPRGFSAGGEGHAAKKLARLQQAQQ